MVNQVCDDCGIKANRVTCAFKYNSVPRELKFQVSTYHKGICHVCGETKHITEARDFFYPDFKLLNLQVIDKDHKDYYDNQYYCPYHVKADRLGYLHLSSKSLDYVRKTYSK